MWKIIRGSYSATRELVRFLGEGKELLVKGLEEFNKGMETLNFELESMNTELRETSVFKSDIHQLKLCLLTIESNQRRTSTIYENLHRFYDLSKETIDVFICFLQMAIDKPKIRPLIQNIIDEIKANITSTLNEDEEWKIELELMHSNGLDKNAKTSGVFNYYFEFYPKEELEKQVKPELSNLVELSNSMKKTMDNLRQSILSL